MERIYDRGTRQGERAQRLLGEEYRQARLALGFSQRHVAGAIRISRPTYGRIERGIHHRLSLLVASRIASVLGLELSVRIYPGGSPIRDAAHTARLQRLLQHVAAPLRYRTEVPLPATTDHPERRSWDAVLLGHGERTVVELETRLYDVQAQLRRINLKRRDDHGGHLLVVVALTRSNRRILREAADLLLPDLPRLRTADVLGLLRSGQHPPTGVILL